MKKLRGTAILMMIAILCITGFQAYWLYNNYIREKYNLDVATSALFRETVEELQVSKLRWDDSSKAPNVRIMRTSSMKGDKKMVIGPRPPLSLIQMMHKRSRDSMMMDSLSGSVLITMKNDSARNPGVAVGNIIEAMSSSGKINGSDSIRLPGDENFIEDRSKNDVRVEYNTSINVRSSPGLDIPGRLQPVGNTFFRFAYFMDSVFMRDSITVREIKASYRQELRNSDIDVGFHVDRIDSVVAESDKIVTIGFTKPLSFRLSLNSYAGYMFDQLKLPILFSLLLVGITIASFVLLYRTMMRQRRLAELKNEFISNITHELKTPIATVGVAIEALKNFNAIDDPGRTREYLDISQHELQRLNLLVDKVLKLSMFEKKEIDLKYELTDLKDSVNEVVTSMRLQIEKHKADVRVNIKGSSIIKADRLHILSVIFNLLDNALKYSKDNPGILINIEEKDEFLLFTIADNGIGIPEEFREKVFEKFFRVPQGDTHNAKGYGLGLSYVAHVVKKHKGTIHVQQGIGKGVAFVISLPKNNQ